MKLGGGDNLCKFLHVHRLDVNDVCRKSVEEKVLLFWQRTEALVGDVQVPQVDPQIIGGNVRLLIGIHGNRVYMIRVRIGIHFSWHCRDNVVLLRHPR